MALLPPALRDLPSATAVLGGIRSALPTPRPPTPFDILLAHAAIGLSILTLVPPPTRAVRTARAALAPLVVAAWFWLGYVPVLRSPQERWGTTMLLVNFAFRALETLVAFPPEFHVYRLKPTASGAVAEPEPVPPPWTWAKAEWAMSLWWSWRGIGWNYGPPLASSMREEPYTTRSSRRHYLLHRGIYLVAVYAVEDLASTFMRLVAPDFYVSATTPYAALNTWQRGWYSIAVVARILCSIEFTHVGCSLACVAAGGYFGLEGELWSPWGWPPVFASVGSIWNHPGLAYMWNRAWNQYNRRMLHCWAWVGICETLLRLTPSGESVQNPRPKPKAAETNTNLVRKAVTNANKQAVAPMVIAAQVGADTTRPRIPLTPPVEDGSDKTLRHVAKANGSDAPQPSPPLSPPDSGCSTPTVPYQPDPRPPRASLFTNLFKSFIVFAFSGLHHDWASFVMMLDAVGRGETVRWRRLFSLSPFFLMQPLGLAFEAVVKQHWRRFKHERGWPPGPPSTLERAVGFVWTWVWLGWTARFFVEGTAALGIWRHFPQKTFISALGWVWGV